MAFRNHSKMETSPEVIRGIEEVNQKSLEVRIMNFSAGYQVAVWSEEGLYALGFPKESPEAALADLALNETQNPLFPQSTREKQLEEELARYWKGENVHFSTVVDLSGYTPFRRKALEACAVIPYGALKSYGDLAVAVGSPKASRAIGGAMGANRTPVVIPCHRVIGSSGTLTGFAGGMEMKRRMLKLENVMVKGDRVQ